MRGNGSKLVVMLPAVLAVLIIFSVGMILGTRYFGNKPNEPQMTVSGNIPDSVGEKTISEKRHSRLIAYRRSLSQRMIKRVATIVLMHMRICE